MIRSGVLRGLLAENAAEGYVFPAYDSYCFSRVPGTLGAVLDVDVGPTLPSDVLEGFPTGVDWVVHVLLDGFGFDHWQRMASSTRFLAALSDRGMVTPLTSIYPSETAAAITTLHTARPPCAHGLLGWYGYYDELDAVLQTLPFTNIDGVPVSEAFDDAPDAGILFRGEPVYEALRGAGVSSVVIQPEATTGTAYTALSTSGASNRGYDGFDELGVTIREELTAIAGPGLVYAYVPDIDAVSHNHGTTGSEYRDVVESITEALWTTFTGVPDHVAERTLLVVSADHGHVDTDPRENIDLRTVDIWDALRRDAAGDPIPPTGGGRNVHLHVIPDRRDAVQRELEALDARVFTRAEAKTRGLFGPGPYGSLFDRRCGDLIVVHPDRAVWHRDQQLGWIGHHGGLNRAEMLVPFAAIRLATLTG